MLIPLALIIIVRTKKGLPFSFMFWLFGLFIVGCGFTHFMGAIEFFIPLFWLGAYVNIITAVASILTVCYLFPMLGQIAKLPLPNDIDAKNKEVEALNNALQSKIQALEAFNYSAAHDLNAPLRVLEGFSEIILQDYADKLDTQGRILVNKIRYSAVKMSNLIKDLLKLSRISSNTSDLKPSIINLSNMVRTILAEFAFADPERKVQTKIKQDIQVNADPDVLALAINNLLSNAWKFSSKNPNAIIEFGSIVIDNEIVYFIKDNGVGFDPAKKHMLFKPFNRLHKQEEFEGNGIGLTIVKRAIDLHQGRVWAEGEVGKGAIFYFTLGI